MRAEQLADLLARGSGMVTLEDLPEQVQGKSSTTPVGLEPNGGGVGAAERGPVDRQTDEDHKVGLEDQADIDTATNAGT